MRRYGPAALVLLLLGSVGLYLVSRERAEPQADAPRVHQVQIDMPDKGYLVYPVRITDRSTAEALTFDPHKGETATLSYRLTRDGRIRIRIARRDNRDLVLRTLLDWTVQAFGRHELQWDGRDASGHIVDNTRCIILFERTDDRHKNHDSDQCHELLLKIVSPWPGDAVRDTARIVVALAGDRAYGDEAGYEAAFFLDYAPARPLPRGSGRERPETPCCGQQGRKPHILSFAPGVERLEFLWDTSPVPNGTHMITIIVHDQHDHVGTASLELHVQN